jgi:hypothetical protein
MKKLTQKFLEQYFEDNQIDDSDLFDCLKNRTGELSLEQINQEEAVITIKLKLHSE